MGPAPARQSQSPGKVQRQNPLCCCAGHTAAQMDVSVTNAMTMTESSQGSLYFLAIAQAQSCAGTPQVDAV